MGRLHAGLGATLPTAQAADADGAQMLRRLLGDSTPTDPPKEPPTDLLTDPQSPPAGAAVSGVLRARVGACCLRATWLEATTRAGGEATLVAALEALRSGGLRKLSLNLDDCGAFDEAAARRLARSLPRGLQELSLRLHGQGDAFLRELALEPRALEGLRVLQLASCAVGDEGCAALGGQLYQGGAPSLSMLWLGGNEIGDAGLQKLLDAAVSGAMVKLKALTLNGNAIGDAGLAALADAACAGAFGGLRALSLDRNAFGDAGLSSFAGTLTKGALTQMGQLSLRGNVIGDEGRDALATALMEGALPACVEAGLDGGDERLRAAIAARAK